MTDPNATPDGPSAREPLGLPVVDRTPPEPRPWYAAAPFLIAAALTVGAAVTLTPITFSAGTGSVADAQDIADADASRDPDSCVKYLIEEVGGTTHVGTATGACIEWREGYATSWQRWLDGDDVMVPSTVRQLAERGYIDGEEVTLPVATAIPGPVPAAAVEAVITFTGSGEIQVVGGTYDDTFAMVDTGKITGPYEVRVALETGFSWSVVSWSGANDVTCRVTIGDRVVIDNSGPNQMSATCQEYSGVQ